MLGLHAMSNTQTATSKPFTETEYSGEITIKISKTLHQKLAKAAEREGVSLDQHLSTLLSEQNAFSSMDQAVSDVQNKLNELNRQLRLKEASANNRRERITYDNRYIEDPDSGLND